MTKLRAATIVVSMWIVALLAAAMTAALTYRPNEQARMMKYDRHAGQFFFNPKPDITLQELAQSVGIMMGGPEFVPGIRASYDSLPESAKRHWSTPLPEGTAPPLPTRSPKATQAPFPAPPPITVPGAPVPGMPDHPHQH